MKGNRKKYILLQFSFIHWYIPALIFIVIAVIKMVEALIAPIATGNLLLFFEYAVIACLLELTFFIYLSCFRPYKIISSIKFYEMLDKKTKIQLENII